MGAYRCVRCDENWPRTPDFKECPTCGRACSPAFNLTGMPVTLAESLRKHAAFDRFYVQHTVDETEREAAEIAALPEAWPPKH